MDTNLGIISLNVRGMRDFEKRRQLFRWFQKKKMSIIMLQEVHSTIDIEKQWYAEWGYNIIFSHGQADARGVCILFKNDFDFCVHNVIKDTEGRYIILDMTAFQQRFTLANVYGYNQDKPEFFKSF